MLSTTRYADYDPFARIYKEYWSEELLAEALIPIEQLLLKSLPENARILDLCCGTGNLSQYLQSKGYQMTGLDGSESMLNYARQIAPNAEFILDDARFFNLQEKFDGIISASGSFNYILSLEDLTTVFHQVYSALVSQGIFVFNLYMAEEYESGWHGSMSGDIQDDYAWAVGRICYPEKQLGELKITIFQATSGECWKRIDKTLSEKWYSQNEIESALEKVGFTQIRVFDAERDFQVHGKPGSAYFVAHKPA